MGWDYETLHWNMQEDKETTAHLRATNQMLENELAQMKENAKASDPNEMTTNTKNDMSNKTGADKMPLPKKNAIAAFVDTEAQMIGLYSIAHQARETGMISEGIEVVVGVNSELFEDDKREPPVKQILAQWKDEGLIHEVYVFDRNKIIRIVPKGLWRGVFNKLFLFNLTDYDKLIQLDTDILIRQNIRYWFEYDTPCAIQAKDKLEWNSGAMVISPNQTVFEELMAKLPDVRVNDMNNINMSEPDNWNSGHGQQGFLSAYFTTSSDPSLRMKTMPTENAVLISSLRQAQYRYFWHRRNHIFDTVHLTVAKPWNGRTKPSHPLECQVLREWEASVVGLEAYNMSISNRYLQNCPSSSEEKKM